MPRFHVISDLHLDHAVTAPAEIKRRRPTTAYKFPRIKGVDAIINAGDWANGPDHRLSDCVQSASVPIVTVMGNHDWYGLDITYESARWKHEIRRKKQDVHVMNPGTFDVCDDVRVIGCTWWSGLGWSEAGKSSGAPLDHETLLRGVGRAISDFAWIGNDRGNLFSPHDMVRIQDLETQFLRRAIQDAKADRKTVVVLTHYGPSRRGIAARFAGSLLNPYFFNDQEALTAGVHTWIHGHTHVPCDFTIPETGCRVICNPRGYGSEEDTVTDGLAFRPELVIEIE